MPMKLRFIRFYVYVIYSGVGRPSICQSEMAEKKGNPAQVPRRHITKAMIQSKWGFLKQSIVLQDITDYLIQNNVLTPGQNHDLEMKNSSDRTGEFLYILFKQQDFTGFAKALEEAGCSYILDVLEGKAECPVVNLARKTESHVTADHQAGKVDGQEIIELLRKMDKKYDEKLSDVTQRLTEMKQDNILHVAKLSEKLTASHEQVQELQKSITDLEEQIKTGKLNKEEMEKELVARTRECRELKDKNKFLQQQFDIAISKTISDDKKVELEDMNKNLEAYKDKVRKMGQDRDDNMAEMKRLNEELSNAKHEKRELKENEMRILNIIEENKKTIAKLETKLDRLVIWKP